MAPAFPSDRLDRQTVGALTDRMRRTTPGITDIELSWEWWAYGAMILRPALRGFTLERRVPDLSASNVVADFDGGHFVSIRPLGDHSACLAEAARDPDDEVLGDDDALLTWMYARVVDGHLEPLHQAVREAVPGVSLRVLWGNLVSEVVSVMADASLSAGADRRRVWRDTVRSLTAGPPQLRRKAVLFTLLDGDRTRIGAKRTTCCLAYRFQVDGELCRNCPLLSDRDAVRMQMVAPSGG